jgi:acetyltransferase
LHTFFQPQSVAVIGAKEREGSVGCTLFSNLITSFKGDVYPVNPKYKTILGYPAYKSLLDIPKIVDLAVIVTPAHLIPDIIDSCCAAKVTSIIIISAGFKETGAEGLALEQEVLKRAQKGNIRIMGPNCLGLMTPHLGLNATFAADLALPGRMAFISQSGALCTAVLDWSLQENIGFSAFVSIGSMSDVQWSDLISYFEQDPHTESILIYMETVGHARSFLRAAKKAALLKPIILIKPGKTVKAAQAAASHTGSLAGADDVFNAAIERVGIVRVDTIEELFSIASLLAKQPYPKGPKLAIITNAGGPAVLATDAACINGAEMASLSEETIEKLNLHLPHAWSHGNPVDILGDADAARYHKAIEIVAEDQNVDGMLVILTPQDMTESTQTAEQLQLFNHKPLLASWMGGARIYGGVKRLNQAGIPTFAYPDSAAKSFASLWKRTQHLKRLYPLETRDLEISFDDSAKIAVDKIFSSLKKQKRTLLSEAESKAVLASYNIPVAQTFIAISPDQAVDFANNLGYPVVLKLHSLTITHKTDVGGVKLNLKDQQQVFEAYTEISTAVASKDFNGVAVQPMITNKGYELILGSYTDAQFGPVILFGSGGELVEVIKDRALELPPLNPFLAHSLMKKTKIYTALQGVRGKPPVHLERLEDLMVHFSRLIENHPRIKECDINPLIAYGDKLIALDARIVLHDFSLEEANIPLQAIKSFHV